MMQLSDNYNKKKGEKLSFSDSGTMSTHALMYSKNTKSNLSLRTLQPSIDAAQLQKWFIMDYAKFWSMNSYSVDQVAVFYKELLSSGHAWAWLGLYKNYPSFLVECYDPVFDEIGQHYRPQQGDMGMHLFIGPPTSHISGFSRNVFAFIMRFMFEHLGANRIVVEPDVNNSKIHALNLDMGFTYSQTAKLKEKTACIAFCNYAQFEKSNFQLLKS